MSYVELQDANQTSLSVTTIVASSSITSVTASINAVTSAMNFHAVRLSTFELRFSCYLLVLLAVPFYLPSTDNNVLKLDVQFACYSYSDY